MKVTNGHHFCKGVTLEVSAEKKLTWTVDKERQKFKYGTIRVQEGGDVAVLDPNKSPDEFVNLLQVIFEFTGCCPDKLDIKHDDEKLNKDFERDLTAERQSVIDLIYNYPLERKARFLWFDYGCGCDDPDCHPNCPKPKISNFQMMPLATTYGDLLKSLGEKTTTGGVTYYDYPDSVWLFVKPITAFHKAVDSVKGKLGAETDAETLYLRFYYDR